MRGVNYFCRAADLIVAAQGAIDGPGTRLRTSRSSPTASRAPPPMATMGNELPTTEGVMRRRVV